MFCFRHAYVIYKLLVHYFLQSYHIEILVQKHLAGGREGERVLEKKPGTSRKHGWSEQNTPILRLLLKFYFSIVICFSLSLLSTSLKTNEHAAKCLVFLSGIYFISKSNL